MSKSDLKARPIFHHKREAIEAHLTIVMAALAVQRTIEPLAGMTRKKLVRELRPLRSGTVVIAAMFIRPKLISTGTKPLLKKLRSDTSLQKSGAALANKH